ncbi:PLP-dependent aminotransferase family protein [Kitasatospora sp. NBC_01287]|uniref:aminotransferase-like domain-containing protein n=1 Tax=Kitasatospora sp. NBC_01287 TaxID=2903573 RepID=UPI00224F0360|nr:PLP-dependent aminotransferase family protein [Kitasatospora sp. NBC_01287]MCX4744979.1 PLP-dependent aminotransferase family protein [Kitasatospora sp. NBC_01287]
MNFLNEVAGRYPEALSLAAGRPHEEFFEIADIHRYLERYQRYLTEDQGYSPEQARRAFFQYGRTKGIIHELVARNLAVDERISAEPESIVVTVGCQEAMFLVLRALRRDERDVVLAVAPTYVGLTGAAKLVDMPVLTVPGGPGGIDLAELAAAVRGARAEGLRPRACYLLADHSNPSGLSLDLPTRHALLELAEREDLLLLEDNPYGVFASGDPAERPPTLKALDRRRRVVHLGSYAKTGLPGARVGFVVADQLVTAADGTQSLLADELAKLKSMLTVNTAPIAQAVIAGKLLEHEGSLVRANAREIALYRENLAHLLTGLAAAFPAGSGVGWNTPSGGFFLVVSVPFEVDDALLETSARDYGLLWTPMHHFTEAPEARHQLRLAVSLLTPDQITEGLRRLTRLINDRLDA